MKLLQRIKSAARKSPRVLMKRQNYILKRIDTTSFGLEIGPSYAPILPKKNGYNVMVADHATADQLREKYISWNVNTALIEDVDYVISASGLYDAIGEENKFDFIIASHVIEHVPDPATFLSDCERLLKPGGILSLVVPDKRYCFDALKPLSTTGQILQAHLEKRKKHNPGTIFDAHAMHLARDGAITWPGIKDLDGCEFVHSVGDAEKIMREYVELDVFMDVHAWQFTPESFAIILSDLVKCDFLGLYSTDAPISVDFEFFLSLEKMVGNVSGTYAPDRRLLCERVFKTG